MQSFLRSIAVCVLTATAASAQTLPQPANHGVHFSNDAVDQAVTDLVGRGITLPGNRTIAKATGPQGNEIIWRETRSGIDSRGARHTFYRQYLVNGSTEAELVGSEVGVHYTPEGAVSSISGHQFRDVTVANRRVLDAAKANERALVRLQNHPTFKAEKTMSASDREYRLKNATLKLVQTGQGNAFRYAWYTIARDQEFVEHNVIIDAQTEEILDVAPLHLGSNCHPSSPYQSVIATGEPVRTDLRANGVRRTLKANVTYDRPGGFTREAFYQGTPYISIVQETRNTPFQCDVNATNGAYTLMPVQIVNGTATYRDNAEWRGHAAGDAMHNTIQTMAAFSTLGRAGWNGINGDSNIVLESTFNSATPDQAFFRMTGNGDPTVPPTPFMGIGPAQDYLNPAASLDHIAHEWGHGVIFTSANFPTTGTGAAAVLGRQMHEGWADVIGHIVEKLRQPAGTNPEQSSDWMMHEDTATGGYARGPIEDGVEPAPGPNSVVWIGASPNGGGHQWHGLNGYFRTYNDTLHRDDQPEITQAHARGNMLSVVLRLMTEGGQNPVCARTALSGCGTNVTSVGLTKAAQILFDTVTWYTPSTARWEDLATYASDAAFDRYNTCENATFPRPAITEQNSVNRAFTAIGYPRLTAARACGF